jgi:hypothetical protein
MGKTTALKEVSRVKTDTTPTAVKNLQKWLRECVYLISEDDSKARFSRVVVRQLVKGNKRGEEVFHLDVPKKTGDEWADNAGVEIYAKLQAETATLGGLQKYALYAFHSGDNESHTSRFVIRLQGVDDDEGEDFDSEGPDKTGLVSQAMRHAEVSNKTMAGMVMSLVSGYQSMISRQASMLDRQSAMVESLLEDKIAGVEAIRLLADDKEERDIKLMSARAKAKGVESLVTRLSLLLPAVANKVAGRPIFPDKDPAIMMMVKGLFTSLASSDDKLKALAQIMGPEESVAFMNILEEVSKTDENGLPKKDEKGGNGEKG